MENQFLKLKKKQSLKKNLICSQKSEFLDEESFIYKSQALY